jgi:hypothetical protein
LLSPAQAGRPRAAETVVALAHALLVIIDHVIARRQPYRELGENYCQHRHPAARAKRLARIIQRPSTLSGSPQLEGRAMVSQVAASVAQFVTL